MHNPMSPSSMIIAAIQMTSGTELDANLNRATTLIAEAAKTGARIVLLPEYFCLMGQSESDKVAICETLGSGKIQNTLAELAQHHGIYLISGTLPLNPHSDTTLHPEKILNTTLIYDPNGKVVGQYDKLHLFRYFNEATQENYDESKTIVAGKTPVACTLDTAIGPLKIGLSICYDLRFPELYRQLNSDTSLDLIVVPAAFTYGTGQAHWEILLRARAIENQCYVLAAGQTGIHENGRHTWGHSMLIDPWGKIVAQREQGEGIVTGLLDLSYMATVRKNLPALQHRCL